MSHVRKNGLPAYKQIQSAIVKRLERGLLRPGDLVDSERELARIHGVSLMTARHALTALERGGYGCAPPRRWDVCRSTKDPFQQVDELHGADVGPRPDCRFKECSRSVSLIRSTKLQRDSRCQPQNRCVKLERLRLSGDEPCAIETCYFSAERVCRPQASPAATESRCSPYWSTSMGFRSAMPTKKWTPPRPMLKQPGYLRFL